MTTRACGWLSVRAMAVARPTMPPPTIAMSADWITAPRIPQRPDADGALACLTLELRHSRMGAVLVLLGGAATGPARAFHQAVPDDGHRALARDHVPALGGHDALDDRIARPLGELAAGPAERDGGDGLALGAVGAGPYGAIHAIERHQAPARVADGHADPDVHLPRLVDCALHDPVRLCERERHVKPPVRGRGIATMPARSDVPAPRSTRETSWPRRRDSRSRPARRRMPRARTPWPCGGRCMWQWKLSVC